MRATMCRYMERRQFLAGIAALPLVVELGAARVNDVTGNWVGTLRYGDDSEPFALAIKLDKNGNPIAYLWNPAVGVYDLPMSHVRVAPGQVELVEAKLTLRYDGTTLRGRLSPIGDRFVLTRTASPMPANPPAPPRVMGAQPAQRWAIRIGPVWATPLVAGARIVIGDAHGVLHALDGATGAAAWAYDAKAAIFGTAALDGDTLLLLDDKDVLHCVDAGAGTRLWTKTLGSGRPRDLPGPKSRQFDYRSATPLVVDGIAYLGTGDGTFYALDAKSGTIRWRYDASSAIRSSAAMASGRVIFGTWRGDVVALDAAGGKPSWTLRTGQPIGQGIVTHDGIAIAGSRNTLLYGINADTGKSVWERYYFTSWVESAPVIVDGIGYIGSSDMHAVRAFDPSSGKVRWSTAVYGWSWGTPLVAGDTVFVATAAMAPYLPGMLAGRAALRKSDGAAVWRDAQPPTKGLVTGYSSGPVETPAGEIVYASVRGDVAAYK